MKDLPPLPTLRELTAMLRNLNLAYSHPVAGGEYVCLLCEEPDFPSEGGWRLAPDPGSYLTLFATEHREYVPGDCGEAYVDVTDPAMGLELRDYSTFDAVGAARRLLASARDGLAAHR